MNNKLSKIKCIAIFLAGISITSIPTMAHADWSITGLGFLNDPANNGNRSIIATAINDSGQVVGSYYSVDGDSHAFITGPNGIGMTDLGTFGGSRSYASGINDSGQVVGSYYSVNDDSHAFITGPNGIGMTDLGTFGGSRIYANGINDSGQVVGSYYSVDGAHTFITGPNGIGMADLGTFGIMQGTNGINDSGQVVGSSLMIGDDVHTYAFITGPNGIGLTNLGTLDGNEESIGPNSMFLGTLSMPSGINDSGQVVGFSFIAAPHADIFVRAFITDPNGIGMTDLGTLGGNNSAASGINDSGEVVGSAATATLGESHSFIFSHGGITDLSLLAPVVADGWTDIVVISINNNGQMVGYGQHHGIQEAFLLSYTPDTVFDPKPIYVPQIPEPETYAMLLAGLGLLGFMARRRIDSAV